MPVTHQDFSAIARRVLVVDDDAGQRSLLDSFLGSQGFDVTTAAGGKEALERLAQTPFRIMISDVRMPGMTGLELLREARALYPGLHVLLVTAFADIRDAVDAIHDGAVNYLAKPIDLDELLALVQRVVGAVTPALAPEHGELQLPEGVVAVSPEMRELLKETALIAPSEVRVLISGESGVGKEVVADLIHAWSPRAGKPMMKVNCAAIPGELLESELFGHEKGAFTGATSRRVGRFEEAEGGTILLDEISEMSMALQAKLLRVTQNGAFQRVGSNEERRANARILAASNRNMEGEVAKGRFREDLFYRLNVVELYVASLRERREDILPLATRFAREFSRGNPRLSASVVDLLKAYDWPGNVRELRNAMERAALMAQGDSILPEHLPPRVLGQGRAASESRAEGGATRMEDVERATILRVLREHDFNRTATALALGISRRALIYKLRRYEDQGHAINPE